MKKYLDADSAYEILDRFFAKIQKNRHRASQKMLNETWNEWTRLPNALNIAELNTRLREACDKNMMISYADVVNIIADEVENCPKRTCKFCGKSRQETVVIPVRVNDENIYACNNCISKIQDITSIGFSYALGELNPKANKKIDLYIHFTEPELWANASYAKVSYVYENDVSMDIWETKTSLNLIAESMGMTDEEITEIIKNKQPSDVMDEIHKRYNSIEFCTEEEYIKGQEEDE